MVLLIIFVILGIIVGILAATLPYGKPISNTERLKWGAQRK